MAEISSLATNILSYDSSFYSKADTTCIIGASTVKESTEDVDSVKYPDKTMTDEEWQAFLKKVDNAIGSYKEQIKQETEENIERSNKEKTDDREFWRQQIFDNTDSDVKKAWNKAMASTGINGFYVAEDQSTTYFSQIQKHLLSTDSDCSSVFGKTVESAMTFANSTLKALDEALDGNPTGETAGSIKSEHTFYESFLKNLDDSSADIASVMKKITKTSDVPYSALAKDGVITYNGVTFVCDEEKSAICLGDMSNPKDVLTIPLSEGGCLRVNRNNIGGLGKAIGMFSPEDIKRIMQAIAQDNKVREMQYEIDETVNGIGGALISS